MHTYMRTETRLSYDKLPMGSYSHSLLKQANDLPHMLDVVIDINIL